MSQNMKYSHNLGSWTSLVITLLIHWKPSLFFCSPFWSESSCFFFSPYYPHPPSTSCSVSLLAVFAPSLLLFYSHPRSKKNISCLEEKLCLLVAWNQTCLLISNMRKTYISSFYLIWAQQSYTLCMCNERSERSKLNPKCTQFNVINIPLF